MAIRKAKINISYYVNCNKNTLNKTFNDELIHNMLHVIIFANGREQGSHTVNFRI